MMVRRGTGICSENCEKLANLPVNNHRVELPINDKETPSATA